MVRSDGFLGERVVSGLGCQCVGWRAASIVESDRRGAALLKKTSLPRNDPACTFIAMQSSRLGKLRSYRPRFHRIRPLFAASLGLPPPSLRNFAMKTSFSLAV